MPLHLFAGLCVREFEVARPWYERLLGDSRTSTARSSSPPLGSSPLWTCAPSVSAAKSDDSQTASTKPASPAFR